MNPLDRQMLAVAASAGFGPDDVATTKRIEVGQWVLESQLPSLFVSHPSVKVQVFRKPKARQICTIAELYASKLESTDLWKYATHAQVIELA